MKRGDFLYAQTCTEGFYCETASDSPRGSGLCPPGECTTFSSNCFFPRKHIFFFEKKYFFSRIFFFFLSFSLCLHEIILPWKYSKFKSNMKLNLIFFMMKVLFAPKGLLLHYPHQLDRTQNIPVPSSLKNVCRARTHRQLKQQHVIPVLLVHHVRGKERTSPIFVVQVPTGLLRLIY